jgi:subtilase family serine protease
MPALTRVTCLGTCWASMSSDGGGTSAATPLWAAVIALADQYAGHDLGFVNLALYGIAGSARYRAAFHDVTKGNNN